MIVVKRTLIEQLFLSFVIPSSLNRSAVLNHSKNACQISLIVGFCFEIRLSAFKADTVSVRFSGSFLPQVCARKASEIGSVNAITLEPY